MKKQGKFIFINLSQYLLHQYFSFINQALLPKYQKVHTRVYVLRKFKTAFSMYQLNGIGCH